jgi:hypothetical protein
VAARGQRAELAYVELPVADLHQVTRRPGTDQPGARRAERGTQPLDRAVQGAPRARGRAGVPQHLGQRVTADYPARAQQQRGQQHPLARRGHRHLPGAVADQ